jgi:uncharacterized protein (DUF849 family)
LILVDQATTVEEFIGLVHAERLIEEIDFVVLDYFQMLEAEDATRFRNPIAMAEYCAEQIRRSIITGDSKIVLVAASSFTKGSESDKPDQGRFRSTFTISHAAATMWGMYRNKEMDMLCINCVKQRFPKPGMTTQPDDVLIQIDPSSGIVHELTQETETINI